MVSSLRYSSSKLSPHFLFLSLYSHLLWVPMAMWYALTMHLVVAHTVSSVKSHCVPTS